MISQIKFHSKCDKAMRFLFGKSLLCANMDVAVEVARATAFDCVTLDGDKVSSRGPLVGGYFDTSRSRLEMHRNKMDIFTQIQQLEAKLDCVKRELEKMKATIINVESDMQENESKCSKAM